MKRLFILAALCAVFYTTHAQIKPGIKAGLNITNIVGKDIPEYRSKVGFHFGLTGNLEMTKNLGVRAELLYSAQGARWDDDNEKTTLNYLQLPVLVRYRFDKGFFAEAGPQIGFLLKAEDDDEGDIYNIKEFVKKSDISLALGVGYSLNTKFDVYARYNASFTKYYDEEKNSVFQFGVNYIF